MGPALLTGAAGFVGANLARRLIAEEAELHAVVRPGSDLWRLEQIAEGLELHETDLRDREAVERLVAKVRPARVFHLAAYGAYSSQEDLERIFSTVVVGTVNLLGACLDAGFESFVNAGSSSEYGRKDHAPAETETPEPNSNYAAAKLAATLYLRQAGRERDAQVTTLRVYSAFGPWEEPSRFIPTLLAHGLRGSLPPLVDPEVARDFVHTEDVLDAFMLAAEPGAAAPGALYNVGSGTQTTIGEAVEAARRLFGIESEPQWGSMPQRGWDTDVWVADPSLIERELGWRPRRTFEQGLDQTVAWLRDEAPRERYGL